MSESLLFMDEGAKPPTPLFASKYAATPMRGYGPATPRPCFIQRFPDAAFIRYLYNYSSSGPVGLENVVSSIRFKRYTGYSEVDGKREYDDYTGSSSGLINTIYTTSSTCATFDDVYWMERPSEIVSSGYTSSLNVFESSDTESIVDTLNADTAKEVDWMIKTVTEDGLPVQIPWIAD